MITTAEIRKVLWKTYTKLTRLQSNTKSKSKRNGYIRTIKNYLWFLMALKMKDTENLRLLDDSDVIHVRKNKPVCITRCKECEEVEE